MQPDVQLRLRPVRDRGVPVNTFRAHGSKLTFVVLAWLFGIAAMSFAGTMGGQGGGGGSGSVSDPIVPADGTQGVTGGLAVSGAVTASTGGFSDTVTVTKASGSNAVALATAGSRVDFGPGGGDHASSDGANVVTFASTLQAVTLYATSTLYSDGTSQLGNAMTDAIETYGTMRNPGTGTCNGTGSYAGVCIDDAAGINVAAGPATLAATSVTTLATSGTITSSVGSGGTALTASANIAANDGITTTGGQVSDCVVASGTTTGTVTLDFASTVCSTLTIAATGNIDLLGTNYGAGRHAKVRIAAGASGRTISYDADWVALGAAADTSIASGKVFKCSFDDDTGDSSGSGVTFACAEQP